VLQGYWQLADKLTDGLLLGYLRPVEDHSVEAVKLVCQRIEAGQAGLNTSFPPTPADIAERVAAFEDAVKERPPLYNGLLSADFGHGLVDLRGLTNEEQDRISGLHGILPDGRNIAFLSLEEKRAVLTPESLKALEDANADPRRIGATVKRMQ
jgi:hypothetical protein